MDFLSTGEKIKRARVYKGMTLKELCKKDISISKMSCIENGKIQPEKWVLELVSDRLSLDIDYLLCDDVSQLKKSIEKYSLVNDELTERQCVEIIDNVRYCLSRDYYDLGFQLEHILMAFYIKYRKFDKVPLIMDDYNLLYKKQKSYSDIYYEDLAKYFMARRNYKDAITYFNILLNVLKQDREKDYDNRFFIVSILVAICYTSIGDIDKSFDILNGLLQRTDEINENNIIGTIYGRISSLKILKNENYEEEIKLFEKLVSKDNYFYTTTKVAIGNAYLKAKRKEEALAAFREVLSIVSNDNKMEYAEFLLLVTESLINNNEFNDAIEYSDMALELSINQDNLVFIELSYYYKSKIAKSQGSFIQWEMYMNLSIDLLLKFGTYDEKNARYLEMANMYHIIGETRESLKYLSLFIDLQKALY